MGEFSYYKKTKKEFNHVAMVWVLVKLPPRVRIVLSLSHIFYCCIGEFTQ